MNMAVKGSKTVLVCDGGGSHYYKGAKGKVLSLVIDLFGYNRISSVPKGF